MLKNKKINSKNKQKTGVQLRILKNEKASGEKMI